MTHKKWWLPTQIIQKFWLCKIGIFAKFQGRKFHNTSQSWEMLRMFSQEPIATAHLNPSSSSALPAGPRKRKRLTAASNSGSITRYGIECGGGPGGAEWQGQQKQWNQMPLSTKLMTAGEKHKCFSIFMNILQFGHLQCCLILANITTGRNPFLSKKTPPFEASGHGPKTSCEMSNERVGRSCKASQQVALLPSYIDQPNSTNINRERDKTNSYKCKTHMIHKGVSK